MDTLLGYRLEVTGLSFLTEYQRTTTLTARVWHGGNEATDTFPAQRFHWFRESGDPMADAIWN